MMLVQLQLIVAYPDFRLGLANGNNLGIATNLGGFSTSAAAGEMVLRALYCLILQSGGSAAAFIMDVNNYVNINNRLIFDGVAHVHDGSPQGIASMQSGSLSIGSQQTQYHLQGGALGGGLQSSNESVCPRLGQTDSDRA